MPKTLAALDSLLARLLRTETLIALIAIVLQAVDVFSAEQSITSGVIAAAVFVGRSLVKATGYRDDPAVSAARDNDAIQV